MRKIQEIIEDLKKPVPDKYIKTRNQGGRDISIEGDIATVSMACGKSFLIDACDLPLISNVNLYIMSPKRNHTSYVRADFKHRGEWLHIFLHRLILAAPDGLVVDHIDHDGLNNCRSNLRLATYSQNGMNRVSNGKSPYKGVVKLKQRNLFQARIKVEGKRIHLGYYKTDYEAAQAYDKKAKEIFGDFALLNISKGEINA